MHTHEDGTTHEHDPLEDAVRPTVELLLQEAADNVANANIELVQAKATIAMQNQIIEAMKAQLKAE